ncbi:hypothetical protein LEL_05975 [Akanthomyces lecanii RCEF 1005]|uniref:Uncharacterized protein n=1 Tax=Akanthomyces lecanii RCEF 1005 TaxID=1081108 RepID=A0A168GBY5_CORDF|nr:hypothetical protein LEL_05975 [Akanthomyces lecanii RCEF 1005]
MELAASDDASPISARQFRRRKSLGELVQGIKIKYSREKMTKDSDADSRNQSRSEAYTSLEPISGSQSMLLQNPWQQRCSLPIPVPERYASIAYDSLPVSPVSSTPPRLDVLHDLASDNVQKASTFRDGLEKAVNDINTKYGDSTKALISSSSPTNSIALRDKNTFRSRFVVPIYGEERIPNARPVIGELWTALKSQDEPLQSSKPHADISTDNSNTASPFHDSHKVDLECSEFAAASTTKTATAADDVSTSTSQPGGNESQERLYRTENAAEEANVDQNQDNSHSDETVSGNAKEKTDIISQDKTDVAGTEPGSPFESPNEDSLYSQDSGSTSALSQGTSSDQNSSVANYIATNKCNIPLKVINKQMSLKNKTKCR